VADIVSLQDVKTHLRYTPTDTVDDVALQGFIHAANDVVQTECGDILPATYDENHDGGSYVIYLRHTPVLSIDNVEEGWGWWNWELDYQQVNTVPAGALYAYSLDMPTIGAISRRSAGNVQIPFVPGTKNIRVQYTAGRDTVPGAVRLFALELIAYWWRISQQRAMQTAASTTQYQQVNEDFTRSQGITSINLGIPAGLLEVLKPYRHTPYIG
jgi:hypothetical protein